MSESRDAGGHPEEVDRRRALRQRQDRHSPRNQPHDLPPQDRRRSYLSPGRLSARVRIRPARRRSRRCCPSSCASARRTTRASSSRRSPPTRAIGFRCSTPRPSPTRCSRHPRTARMLNRLRSVVPNYPIQVFHGDYQHFVQNKDTRVGGRLSVRRRPAPLLRGPHRLSRRQLQRQLAEPRPHRDDHPPQPLHRPLREAHRRPNQPRPPFDVTAELQICPQNAGTRPAGEPGPTFTRPDLRAARAQHPQLEPHRHRS